MIERIKPSLLLASIRFGVLGVFVETVVGLFTFARLL
jgi:hypothetical protein